MSVFIKIGDTYYKDLKVFVDNAFIAVDTQFFTNYGFSSNHDLRIDVDDPEIESMLTDIKPKKGSTLYVTPNCPVPSADLRKNYTIKRAIDAGDYNIICNARLYRWYGYYTIIPHLNTLLIKTDWQAKGTYLEFMNMVKHIQGYENLSTKDFTDIKHGSVGRAKLSDLPEIFVKLYEGTLTKPAVSYKNLDLDFGLEMNDDIVELVYRTGIQSGYENLSKHILELEALNQYNWRDYPRTMYFLTNVMAHRYNNCFTQARSRQSSQPKSVKQILNANFQHKAASQEDYDLALRFMRKICDIQDTKFVMYDKIASKMNEKSLPVSLFLDAFNAVVKITPKAYEADNGTV